MENIQKENLMKNPANQIKAGKTYRDLIEEKTRSKIASDAGGSSPIETETNEMGDSQLRIADEDKKFIRIACDKDALTLEEGKEWKKEGALDPHQRWELVQKVVREMASKGYEYREIMSSFDKLPEYKEFKEVLQSVWENHKDRQEAFRLRQAAEQNHGNSQFEQMKIQADAKTKIANEKANEIVDKIGHDAYMSLLVDFCHTPPIKVYITDDGQHFIPSFDFGLSSSKEEEDEAFAPFTRSDRPQRVTRLRYACELPLSNCHLALDAPNEEGWIVGGLVPSELRGNRFREIFRGDIGSKSKIDRCSSLFEVGDRVYNYENEEAEIPDHRADISCIETETNKIYISAKIGNRGEYEYEISDEEFTMACEYGKYIRIFRSERGSKKPLSTLPTEFANKYIKSFYDPLAREAVISEFRNSRKRAALE